MANIDIVSCLPTEIARTIFHLSLWIVGYRLKFICYIASVCQSWREIVIGDPFLWNDIFASLRGPIHFKAIALRLKRSANAPLHITVIYKRDIDHERNFDLSSDQWEYGRPAVVADQLMRLLVPHIHRWGSLEINMRNNDEETSKIVTSHLSGTAHMLTFLTYYRPHSIWSDTEWMSKFACPGLHTLSTDAHTIYSIKVNQLQTLRPTSLQSLSVWHSRFSDHSGTQVYSSVLDILHISENLLLLTSLSLDGSDSWSEPPLGMDDPPPSESNPSYILANLVKVNFRCCHLRIVQGFFASLQAPLLEEINMSHIYAGGPAIARPISARRLRTLSLVHVGDIQPLVRRLPILDCEHLLVASTPSFDDSTLLSMSRPNVNNVNGGWISPHLESLEIDNCSRVSVAYLRRFVECRLDASVDHMSGVAVIKRLVVHSHRDIVLPPEDKDYFTQNLELFVWDTQQPTRD